MPLGRSRFLKWLGDNDRILTELSWAETFHSVPLEKIFERFAAAGFFYSNGWIECCVCQLRISNWAHINDPWIIHCVKSPYCEYINRHRGHLWVHNTYKCYLRLFDYESLTCTICYVNQVDHVLTCGHVYCTLCVQNLERCPLCKRLIYSEDQELW